VRIATREHGVQSVVARGARRPRSRFGHSLDLFASGIVHFTMRPGRDLSTLSGFDLTAGRFAIAADLDRFAAASAMAELVLRFSRADPHDDAFAVLGDALDALTAAPAGSATDQGIAFAWQYVGALGFAPTMEACCSCHAAIAPDESAPFSHEGGGVVCGRCTRSVSVGRALPAGARLTIAAWLLGGHIRLAADPDRRAHLRLLTEFIHHHLAEGGSRELCALDAWEARVRASQ
jgi:DNA repair protein RecO (recombination protein O)